MTIAEPKHWPGEAPVAVFSDHVQIVTDGGGECIWEDITKITPLIGDEINLLDESLIVGGESEQRSFKVTGRRWIEYLDADGIAVFFLQIMTVETTAK